MQDISPLSWLELISIVASLVSLVLGIVAIALSIAFYRFSTESSNSIKESADRIGASVSQLQLLFDRLYTDTFSMMHETVTDMRQHVWDRTLAPSSEPEETEQLIGQRIAEIQTQTQQAIAEIVSKQSSTDAKINELGSQVQSVVDHAIEQSSHIETQVREEAIRTDILTLVRDSGGILPAATIIGKLQHAYPPGTIINGIQSLVNRSILGVRNRSERPRSSLVTPETVVQVVSTPPWSARNSQQPRSRSDTQDSERASRNNISLS